MLTGVDGTVVDHKGAPLRQAVVRLLGAERNITLDDTARFHMILPEGAYMVTASAPGENGAVYFCRLFTFKCCNRVPYTL